MIDLLAVCTLFAERNVFHDMGSGFRGENAKINTTEVTIFAIGVVCAGILFWVLSRAANWREGRGAYNDPQMLFKRLCSAHSLGRNDRWLLRELNRINEITSPAAIFLRPEVFETASANTELCEHSTAIEQLSQRLFGENG
ncbi:MAG: hypothetical protein SGJ20_04900 [Planctomycetota bacterium]|nr:hypothetical protein [Planctomycetota bacterium]